MIAEWLSDMGADAASLLMLLIVGHVLGDFLFQSHRIALLKEREVGATLQHGAIVFVVQCGVLWPFLGWGLVLGIFCLSALHVALDALRSRAFGRWGMSLGAFFVDQALHLLSILALWRLLSLWSLTGAAPWSPSNEWLLWYSRWSLVGAAYVFNAKGATRIVRGVLERFPKAVPPETEGADSEYEMGRWIGNLERFLILTLALAGQWAALGFVVAAKSVARFPEFRGQRHKDFAEYYLIGTLTSALVALASALAVGTTVLWPAG
jgi:hypothetical protein